jgi:hypothetical protein
MASFYFIHHKFGSFEPVSLKPLTQNHEKEIYILL